MAPQLALIASGQVGFVGYLYHPLSGTHNLNDPVGIHSLFLPWIDVGLLPITVIWQQRFPINSSVHSLFT